METSRTRTRNSERGVDLPTEKAPLLAIEDLSVRFTNEGETTTAVHSLSMTLELKLVGNKCRVARG